MKDLLLKDTFRGFVEAIPQWFDAVLATCDTESVIIFLSNEAVKITVFEVTILTASLFVDRDAQIHTQPSPPSSRWLIQINAIIHLFKYKPNSGNVGTFFKIWIKWRLKYFQITWANILFTIEHREHNKCFKLRNFTLISTEWAPFKFDDCYRSQKSWHGLKKQEILKRFSWENI